MMASVAVQPPPVYPHRGQRRARVDFEVWTTRRMSSARPRRSATTMVADHNDHEQGSSSGPDQQGAGGLIRTEDAEDAADDAEEAEDEEKLLPWQACVHASPSPPQLTNARVGASVWVGPSV